MSTIPDPAADADAGSGRDRPLAISLAVMRLSTGAFFLIWALEKILAPDVARRVFETFYASSPSDTVLALIGIAQGAIVLAFMAGVLRFWTTGALLAMHTVSMAVSVPRLIDPFTPPNHLFWAGVPVIALLAGLLILRQRDTLLVLPWPKGRKGASLRAAPIGTFLALALLVAAWPAAAQTTDQITVHTYAAQPKLVDTVNTHWIETGDGLIVIDAQRVFPEAERAVRHIQALDKPVLAIFVTHPHTDHYGGLPVFRDAFPEAPVYAAAVTIRSMREDSRGYNAARLSRHGEIFPTQAVIDANLPERVIADGDVIALGGLRIEVHELGASEAEVSSMLYLPDHDVLFAADLINNGFVPAPLEDLDTWLEHLDIIDGRFSDDTMVYIGHGAHGALGDRLPAQRDYLTDLRDAVAAAIQDGLLDSDEADAIALALESRYPHWHGVGGNPRSEVLRAVAGFVAEQRGAEVRSDAAFR